VPDARIELVKRAYTAFAARDVETLVEISAEDVEVSTVTGLLAGRTDPYRGHAELESYLQDVVDVWEELSLEPMEFFALGEGKLLVFGRIRARQAGGRVVDMPNAWLWEIEGGKVTSVRVFADVHQARRLVPGALRLSSS
jgi:ketosteroid isomerase-like protein